jgi:hypothetical protein
LAFFIYGPWIKRLNAFFRSVTLEVVSPYNPHSGILHKECVETGSGVDYDIRFGTGDTGEDHVLIPVRFIQGILGLHDYFS